jgi:Metallopeptidase family M24
MVGEPTTFTAAWFDAFPEAADATPLLVRARSLKTAQEIERLRLANEIAAAAMEHVRSELRAGMKESEAAALWQGFVHGEGTGWSGGKVELALPFSLVWAGRGIKTFTATGDLPVGEGEPVLFEIWVCADGSWADHTKNLVLGALKPEYAELETAHRWRSSTGACAQGSRRWVMSASRRIRSATAWARGRTSRRTRIKRAAASSRQGWCSRSSPAFTGRAAEVSESRTISS